MKRVAIASDDAMSRAWAAQALAPLDAIVTECPLGDLQGMIAAGEVNLAVVDAGRTPDALSQLVETAASGGAEVRLLLLVESDSLAGLRLPIRVGSDFLVRGSSSEELVARARLMLWPGEETMQQELIRLDELTINLATYQAYLGGTPIDFTYLEYALFAFLVTHPGRTYSREVLLRRVWGTDYYGGSRTVDVHIRRIRSKIGAESARRLETVRNVGYLWNG